MNEIKQLYHLDRSKHLRISNFNLILTPDNSLKHHFSRGICVLAEESQRLQSRLGKGDTCEHGDSHACKSHHTQPIFS